MAIGVFGLQVAYKLKRTELMSTDDTHGWFGGGSPSPGANVSTVERIDFSNDLATASPRSPLGLARFALAATGNSNYGWFGGGYTSVPVSRVDRINFSNDLATASLRGNLSAIRSNSAATSNTSR